jgi:hypothetical protein
MARTNGSSSNALKTALPALKAHVLTPANAPLLFAPYGPSDALPVCAIEPQIDGVMENRHKAVCMVIAEYVEACIGFHDVKAGRERRFEKRAGKHGLAQVRFFTFEWTKEGRNVYETKSTSETCI